MKRFQLQVTFTKMGRKTRTCVMLFDADDIKQAQVIASRVIEIWDTTEAIGQITYIQLNETTV